MDSSRVRQLAEEFIAHNANVSPHMDTSKLPFEYCALRFLIQWEQRERTLHEQISDAPTVQQVRAALKYFQVAHNFAGIGADDAARAVADALREVHCNFDSKLEPWNEFADLTSFCIKLLEHALNFRPLGTPTSDPILE